jgi:hypothetical protein
MCMRGEVIIICFCLVDASVRPASGRAHALVFDSIAALLGRLFLRPVLIIACIVLDRAPPETAVV